MSKPAKKPSTKRPAPKKPVAKPKGKTGARKAVRASQAKTQPKLPKVRSVTIEILNAPGGGGGYNSGSPSLVGRAYRPTIKTPPYLPEIATVGLGGIVFLLALAYFAV